MKTICDCFKIKWVCLKKIIFKKATTPNETTNCFTRNRWGGEDFVYRGDSISTFNSYTSIFYT